MIRVLIFDRHGLEREQLAHSVAKRAEMELVDCVESLSVTLKTLDLCDVVLVGADLPNDGAYELARTVRRSDKCVQLVAVGNNDTKTTLVRLVEAGILGYVRRSAPPDELARTVQCVARGEAHLPAEVTASVVSRLADLTDWFEEMQPMPEGAQALTRREREVLHLIGRDFTNQDIANHLIIEVGTVKNHVHNILAKLNVNSRREAASAYLALMRSQSHRPRRARYNAAAGPERYFSVAR